MIISHIRPDKHPDVLASETDKGGHKKLPPKREYSLSTSAIMALLR